MPVWVGQLVRYGFIRFNRVLRMCVHIYIAIDLGKTPNQYNGFGTSHEPLTSNVVGEANPAPAINTESGCWVRQLCHCIHHSLENIVCSSLSH